MKAEFKTPLERIKAETGIKTLSDLAKIVGSSQQYVSKKSREAEFPIIWAYSVGKKFGLLTEWIMTGEGPKRLEEQGRHLAFYEELEQWARETSQSEDTQWMRNQIESFFPMFKEWRKRKENHEDFKSVSAS